MMRRKRFISLKSLMLTVLLHGIVTLLFFLESLVLVKSFVMSNKSSRGAFIVFEGVDRCGKTTQTQRLVDRLSSENATLMRFPNRTTPTGKIINEYLSSSASCLDDHAIHLLFSANRWEAANSIANLLKSGKNIVCDRYAYSGVAFSASKMNSDCSKPILDLEWCKAPDRGLPAPDCVIFLDLSPEQAEQRGGYGGERYEKRDMQIRVRQNFFKLQQNDQVPWHVIDAAQSIEAVENDIWKVVERTIQSVLTNNKPLGKMWDEGTIDL